MGKNKWEKLTELPEEYQVNPDLARNAIQAIQQEQAQKAQKPSWWKLHWKKMVYGVAACAVCVGIFVPVYNAYIQPAPITSSSSSSSSSPITPPPVYYADEKVTTEKIQDVNAFLAEKQVQVKYFSTPMTTSHVGIIAETQAFAYLYQQLVYMDTMGFENIGLYAIVLPNSEFDFEKDYERINNTAIFENITITYGKEEVGVDNSVVLAKFIYGDVRYYLEIQTTGQAEAKVLQYVQLLLQGE